VPSRGAFGQRSGDGIHRRATSPRVTQATNPTGPVALLFGLALNDLGGPGRHVATREKIKCSCAREKGTFASDEAHGIAIEPDSRALVGAGTLMRRTMADWNKVGKRFCPARRAATRGVASGRLIVTRRREDERLPRTGSDRLTRRHEGAALRCRVPRHPRVFV